MQENNFIKWLTDVAKQSGAVITDNFMALQNAPEAGWVRLYILEQGLNLIMTEVKSEVTLSELRLSLPGDYLFIKIYLPDHHLETVAIDDAVTHRISTPGVLFHNSRLRLRSLYCYKRDYQILSFALHADWLKRAFPSSPFSVEHWFEAPLFRFELVTPAILQSALNLWITGVKSKTPDLHMKALVYPMLNELFLAFQCKEGFDNKHLKHEKDIEAVFRVRERLLDMTEIRYPTINVLARQAAMSPSKLKDVFRSAFGMSIFEFYQYNRLHFARQLMIGQHLTAKEAGLKIGYHNLGKFAQAYKKLFGYLPHQTALPDRAII